MTELRKTPLHEEHRRLGARLVPFAGWEMPVQYRGITAEHEAVRLRAGLFDVSHMGELWIRGPGAAARVRELVTNDVAGLADGRAAYAFACREDGGILDDLIVYRLAEDRVLVVCNAGNHPKIAAHFAARLRGGGLDDASDRTALLALQGPRAAEALATITPGMDTSEAALPRNSVREAAVAGVTCLVARTGYTGEDGFELFCDAGDAVPLFRALLEAGAPLGVEPAGLGARDTLRLEAKLPLYGNELSESTTPYDAGLGWAVKLDRGDFLGRAALAAAARAPERVLAGFEMTGRGVARHGYPLLSAEGEPLGTCTSGAPSPTLGRAIGLGYLPRGRATPGTPLQVDCRGKLVAARVVATPFYRRPRPG